MALKSPRLPRDKDVAMLQTHRHGAHMRDQVFSVCVAGSGREMEWNFLNPQRDGKGEAQLVHQNLACWSYRAPLECK